MDRLVSRDDQAPSGRSGGTGQVREDWLQDSILSGFVATFAMTVTLAVAYAFASAVGEADGGTLRSWFAGLAENELTQRLDDGLIWAMVLNLIMGLVWAVVYGRFAEPMLGGPGWRKGAFFALIPYVLSIVAFFPLAGVGFLGSDVDAGPLPVIGNLILHLIYGAVLGAMYAVETESGLQGQRGEREAAIDAERGAALGVAIGGILGGIVGWLIGPGIEDIANRSTIVVAGAFAGGAIGILIGSLVGMRGQTEGRRVL
jgi:MFS family permease